MISRGQNEVAAQIDSWRAHFLYGGGGESRGGEVEEEKETEDEEVDEDE